MKNNIQIHIIESNSKANCIALYDNHSYLFLDFGSSNTNINNYCLKHNINSNQIACCLVTHNHIDHISSIGLKCSNNINFYSSKYTNDFIKNNQLNKIGYEYKVNLININKINKWIKIKNTNWKFKAFKTIHNAIDSLGFLIKNKNTKILYLTDTIYFENKLFKNNHCYIVESNYATEYISNNKAKENKHNNENKNHMSLFETETFLKKYKSNKMKLFLFSHLSINGDKQKQLIVDTINCYQNNKYIVDYINPFVVNKQEFRC